MTLHPNCMKGGTRTAWPALFLLCFGPLLAPPATAQDDALVAEIQDGVLDLTLERMVDLAMSSSFQIRNVNLSIQRTRLNLQAERAGLKSRVDLNLQAPEYSAVSEARWNPSLGRNEIIRDNSNRWQADLSVSQPVILFGYPTNGELSFNSRVYRYRQIDSDGDIDTRYYNRYFVEYEQRLFQPNELKNDLEEAELDLESSEMSFSEDVIDLIDETSEQYLELFEDAYDQIIYQEYVDHLEEALELGTTLAENDPGRAADIDQMRIELANAREDLQASRSSYRLATAEMKQEFQLPQSLEIALEPEISIAPVTIPTDRAISLARTLTPRLRNLEIEMREEEISLENTKAQNAFRLDLNFTYGREMQNEFLADLFREPSNSYSASVRAYVPIWDWGQREYRVAAQEISLEQTRLQMEQTTTDIESSVTNEVRNVEEFEGRALNMQENRVLAHESAVSSLERYESGTITASELLQSLEREVDTSQNALEAYLGWRDALLGIQRQTYYDFESDQPVLERFGIDTTGDGPDPLLEEEEE